MKRRAVIPRLFVPVLCMLISALATAPNFVHATVGRVTTFHLPKADRFPVGITSGPDGNLWFTDPSANRIGRMTHKGVVTLFSVPTASDPWGITSGPDGNLWFTEFNGNSIGRITPNGVVTQFSISTTNTESGGITSGPDGNLWFTEGHVSKIGRITPNGVVTEFGGLTANSTPYNIVSSSGGNLLIPSRKLCNDEW